VLYIHLTGVNQEILKNLVLAGVRASLCDARPYPDAVQTTASFFLLERAQKKVKYDSVGHAMKAAVEELNPLLGDCELVEKLPSDLDEATLASYDMVIASHLGMSEASRIAAATTKGGGKFYLVDCFGFNGGCVLDLGKDHQYRPEVGKKLLELTPLAASHVPLQDIFQLPLTDLISRADKKHPPLVWLQYRSILEYQEQNGEWPSEETKDEFVDCIQAWIAKVAPTYTELDCFAKETLQQWAAVATAEISPVCAVLGGMLGNEIVKTISLKGEPANNTLLFEGKMGKCRTVLLKAK
jgi:ubiquitin-like 1-activating enzyme E1 A